MSQRAFVTRRFHLLLFTFFVLDFLAGSVSSGATNFYTLQDKWEKDNETRSIQQGAIEESFQSALASSAPLIGSVMPAPTIRKELSEMAQSATFEMEQNQSLIVRGRGIVKFVSTDEGRVAMDTLDANSLRILGTGFGNTYIHVWDETGRTTFSILVVPPKLVPSRYQLEKVQAIEKTRPFKIYYATDRSAYYTGDKASDIQRSSLDFTQRGKIEGDTPYGFLTASVQNQKLRHKYIYDDIRVKLEDGHVGPFNNFDLYAVDFDATPGLIVFPQARVRGVQVKHWDEDGKFKWASFYGREQSSFLGTLSPSVSVKRTKDSFLSGQVLEYKFNENAIVETGFFTGYGKARPDELNKRGAGAKAKIKFGPHVEYRPEVGFDDEKFANRHALITKFKKLQIKNEFRDVSKRFVTMVGSPSARGEVGYLLDVSADPFPNMNILGSLDIFRDRLIPNPEDLNRANIHRNLSLSYRPWDTGSFLLTYQDMDDTGRIGPMRQRVFGAQYNQSIELLGRKGTIFSRYNHRDHDFLTNSQSNYRLDQAILGYQTRIFWDINFTIEREWDYVDEPIIDRLTHPNAITYSLDYSHQIGDTPFYMDVRLRIRDEEETESPNSFMSGEDSTEVSGGLYYRETPDTEFFVTGRLQNFRPESLNVLTPRVEAEFLAGMRYTMDTGIQWVQSGSFEGYVFKDLNSDAVKQPNEPGLPDITMRLGTGEEAVTDANGFYQFKSVKGKLATLTMGSENIPYGYVPTGQYTVELPITQNGTGHQDFGVAPKSEISGIVYQDVNNDSAYDPGDIGLARARVLLEDGKIAVTKGNGSYIFSGVVAGDHTVRLDVSSLPAGYLPTDVDQKTITLYEGLRYELNFALRVNKAITGRVFLDENRNGRLDADEKGLPGIGVRLGENSVVTDTEGWYLFDQIPSGRYELEVESSHLPDDAITPVPTFSVEITEEPVTLNKDFAITIRKPVKVIAETAESSPEENTEDAAGESLESGDRE